MTDRKFNSKRVGVRGLGGEGFANPMAMIMEHAGGKALADGTRILDVVPDDLHARTSVIMGSANEIDHVMQFMT